MAELDRLVKLLVEKLLRSSKKPEPSGNGTYEGTAGRHKPLERVSEGTAEDETDEKNA